MNASAETEAGLHSNDGAVTVDGSFLSDILGTVRNIGLVVLGVTLLMGVVRFDGLHVSGDFLDGSLL